MGKLEIQSNTNTSDQSGPGSNGIEGVFHYPQTSSTDVLQSDEIQCHTQDTLCLVSWSSCIHWLHL